MKIKFTLLLTGIILSSIYSFAQINFGASAGLNISNIHSNTVDPDFKKGLKAKVGANFGLNVGYAISEKFSLQSGVNYSQMGAKYTENFDSDIYSSIQKIDYLAFPILAKVHFNDFAVYAGPQISILMSAKTKDLENGVVAGTEDSMESVKGTEFSGLLGVEYTIIEKIVLGARYQLGLSDIEKIPSGSNFKLNSFTFSLGYKF